MSRIVIFLGSVTAPGRLHGAVRSAADRAVSAGISTELIDLGQVRLDFADGRPPEQHADDSARLIELAREAQAVVLATPVYRGTYTGALKNLLDLLPVDALQSKPVGIVAMGATQHHFLGAESHLRDVLSWFGALTAPVGVYLASEDFIDGQASPRAAENLDQLLQSVHLLANAISETKLGPAPLAARSTSKG